MKKRLLTWIVTLSILVVCVYLLPTRAQAATEGYYDYIVVNERAKITGANLPSTTTGIVIPSTLGGYPVTSIEYAAFSQCSQLTAVVIPYTVVRINARAFADCTNLQYVSMQYGVNAIGDYAFSGCTGLTSITIPDSITTIGHLAFSRCTGLTSIIIPDSVTNVGDSVFYGCTSLTSVTIGHGVTKISSEMFYNCTSLTSIIIPDNVTMIWQQAFSGCTSLHTVVIPESVLDIFNAAFENCTSLTNITIPNSVTAIGNDAFYNCTSLQNITIPGSVSIVSPQAFYNCNNLTEVIIENGVQRIGPYTFYGCNNLKSIILPSSVAYIGEGEYDAFSGCTNLTVVFYDGTEVQKGDIAFADSDDLLGATWHYEVVETVFANQDCFYCAECDNYYLFDGNYAMATVVFKDWDGSVISTETYHYGDAVTAPTNPTKVADNTYSYIFAGWDKEVVKCAGNTTYTAKYTSSYIDYTVTFKNWDGSVLASDQYHYNDKVTPPSTTPAKSEDSTYKYVFKGWDSQITKVVGNKIYTAIYNAIRKIVEITSNVFNVQGDSIGKVGTGTSGSSFVSNLGQAGSVKVYKGNTQVSGNTVIGTGMEVKLMDGNTVVKSYTVVVTGDTNGDGITSVTDMIAIKAHVLKKTLLTGAYAEAADTSNDNAISITDFIQIKAQILGKSSIVPN